MAGRKIFAASSDSGAGVGLIVLLLLIVLAAILTSPDRGAGGQSTAGASIASSGSPFATATPIPPPGVATFPCETGIAVGRTVNVVHGAVRMRHSPGYIFKDDDQDTKHFLQSGDRVLVLGGPEIVDGLCWWYLEHEGFQGWTANHSRDGVLLLSPGLKGSYLVGWF